VGPAELMSLGKKSGIDSRIIRNSDENWTQSRGPFCDEDFFDLSDWTLLINDVGTYNCEVYQLRKLINFIPSWRFDDIMVSFAAPGGGVGPHFDLYDVFLVQAKGHRCWKIGQECDASSLLRENSDLRLLSKFEVSEEVFTEPGDILYLPPSKAHWGVAQSESITYSIGFRAPRLNDMIAYLTDELLERLPPDVLYNDKLMKPAQRPGEIRSDDLARAREQILSKLIESETTNHWFGDLITESSIDLGESDSSMTPNWACANIRKASNLAWREDLDKVHLYVNGIHATYSSNLIDMVIILCKNREIKKSQLPATNFEESIDCIEFLVEIGAAFIE